MKKLMIFIVCMASFYVKAQQTEKLNTFHIVDSKSRVAIPAVSITIVRAKIAFTTEKDGVFIIPGNLAVMRDTIIIYVQNYLQLKLPLNQLHGRDTISLKKLLVTANNAVLSYANDTLLNNFDARQTGYYAGVHTQTEMFNYLQLAQQFQIPVNVNARLSKVSLVYKGYFRDTQFRIQVYDHDPATGGPGKSLCSNIIEVNHEGSGALDVNLKKYNIIIPGKAFFVAVEWLRNFANMLKSEVYNSKTGKTDTLNIYRPFVGIAPVTGKKLNIWSLNLQHQWKPYNYFYPFGTDLAIKATLEY
jgi:hypothetical protein